MPNQKQIDEEKRDEEKNWKQFLEDYKKNNPEKVNKAATSILQKDGISLQDQIHLRTKFAVKYDLIKRMNEQKLTNNLNMRVLKLLPSDDMDRDTLDRLKKQIQD